jgi:[ribosomal protein S5]-alanine N-acetyltransferase
MIDQLELKRCTIRPWRLDDAESLMKHANNRKVWLSLRDRFPHPYTIDDAHEFLQKKITEQTATNFCIEIDGAAVGGIGIHLGQDVQSTYCDTGLLAGRGLLGGAASSPKRSRR